MTLLAAGLPGAPTLAALVPQAAPTTCYNRVNNHWFCTSYFENYSTQLREATLQHLGITLAAVLLGTAIAFPLALLARRLPRLESAVLGVSTGIYTIPSLALFPLLVPFTGISATTVILGLGLYCLTILVRAFLDGLRSVPDEVKESATGLGYGRGRLLFRIELPLALPVIVAGLRVATVSSVALTTVGTLVANGGLGNLISEGVFTNFRAQLLAACVLCVVLAVVLDLLIVGLQRVATPWTRTQAS